MIDTSIIDNTLAQFGFAKSTERQQLQHFERNDKLRIVMKATTTDEYTIVIKFFDDPDVRPQSLEVQGLMSDCYLEAGVIVPRRYQNQEGRYRSTQVVLGRNVSVTVEDYLPGKELELTSLSILLSLGELLGRMHAATEKAKLCVGNGSAWALFVGSEVDMVGEFDENADNANRFFSDMRNHPIDVVLLDDIEMRFYAKRNELESFWACLPKGAVQGDLSPNNVLVDDAGNITGIIDFHLAGDEVYVNHMMSEGVFLSYSCDQVEGETPAMRDDYLYSFVEGYQRHRTLSDTEKGTLNLLYNIFKPFRFQELSEVKQKASQGLYGEVNQHLQYMSYHLDRVMF